MSLPAETRICEGASAEQRLIELGLTMAGLTEVVRRGEAARAEATANDPVNAAGWDAYRYRVRALRDIFGSSGWERKTQDGLELLWRSDNAIEITTRGGTDAVGVRGGMPQPTRGVGDSTKSAAAAQLSLNPDWFNRSPAVAGKIARLYMLLVFTSETVVRSELSLPSGVGDDGLVDGWVERILLPDIDLTEPDFGATGTPPLAPIDVPVARKR